MNNYDKIGLFKIIDHSIRSYKYRPNDMYLWISAIRMDVPAFSSYISSVGLPISVGAIPNWNVANQLINIFEFNLTPRTFEFDEVNRNCFSFDTEELNSKLFVANLLEPINNCEHPQIDMWTIQSIENGLCSHFSNYLDDMYDDNKEESYDDY